MFEQLITYDLSPNEGQHHVAELFDSSHVVDVAQCHIDLIADGDLKGHARHLRKHRRARGSTKGLNVEHNASPRYVSPSKLHIPIKKQQTMERFAWKPLKENQFEWRQKATIRHRTDCTVL